MIRGFAIGGKAGAGKNALADELSSQLMGLGYWPTLMAFGDTLKAEVWAKHRVQKSDPGGREALISHGDMRRSANPDYFVKALERKVSALWPYSAVPIITDVRRWNEYEWARQSGFYMVRVEASLEDRVRALLRRGEDLSILSTQHPTESELDRADWDFFAYNRHDESLSSVVSSLLSRSCFHGAA